MNLQLLVDKLIFKEIFLKKRNSFLMILESIFRERTFLRVKKVSQNYPKPANIIKITKRKVEISGASLN